MRLILGKGFDLHEPIDHFKGVFVMHIIADGHGRHLPHQKRVSDVGNDLWGRVLTFYQHYYSLPFVAVVVSMRQNTSDIDQLPVISNSRNQTVFISA